MEQSSLFGDGVDIDTEAPASADAAALTDARAQAAARAAELRQWSQREYELLSAARGIARA
mgnify:CR=1 FL=1